MLFKRKSGKDNGKLSQKAHPDGVEPSAEVRPAGGQKVEEGWDVGAHEEMSSLLKDTPASESDKLDETRRAVAQRRASKKFASIDWDVAAREEITALLGGSSDKADSGGSDNDLDSVRRAIARRKAKNSPQHRGAERNSGRGVDNASKGRRIHENEEEKGKGPRLDWLVDFISDDDGPSADSSPSVAGSDFREASSYQEDSGSAPKGEGLRNQSVSLKSNNNNLVSHSVKPDDIEIVPRNFKSVDPSFDPSLVVGDGFGTLGDIPVTEQGSIELGDSAVSDERRHSNRESENHISAPQAKESPVKSRSRRGESEVVGKQKDDRPNKRGVEKEDKSSARQSSAGSVEPESFKTKDRVVGLLLKKQVVTMGQVYEAQKIKEREGQKEALWRILAEMNGVDNDAIYEEAAKIYAFPVADVNGKLDAKFVRSVMETLTEENRDRLLNLHLVPYESESEQQSGGVKLVFITHDPMRTDVRRVMKELKLDRFDLYYAPKSAVESVIIEAFPRKNEYLERMTEDPMAFDLGMSYEDADIIDEDALEAEISRSSLINLFEATLVEAVRQGASDVHIYPNAKKKVEIHFRVDGRLTLWHTEHKVHPEALLAVIKDNAMNVDRFERDAAQDGYIQRWIDDVLIRFRVSVLPIANISHEIRSESIVIRVLDDRKVIRDLRKLGLLDEAMAKFEQAITQPHGMVILTGPTGSGKSTTLVAALHQVITGEVNVLTVEDPVEYIIPGVRQIKLNYKLELENALRAILRHDPDVVMVGEMRDRKTAELAIKLANTGHLTFSTLHTNDAPSAISRLYKMGIEPFLIAYAINLIVAQRLIRLLCSNCKQPDLDPDPIMLEKLGFTKEEISSKTFYVPGNDESCPVCKGIGYKGRRAVSEALYFSREVRHMIVEADKMIDEGAIKEQAVKEGMMTLRDSAREIVKMGQTSVREMIRVVTTDG